MHPALQDIPSADRIEAVRLVRAAITDADRERFADAIAADPKHWSIDHHFSAGMSVRNLLREHGFVERWPWQLTFDLDEVWAPLLELAVLGGEGEVDEAFDVRARAYIEELRARRDEELIIDEHLG